MCKLLRAIGLLMLIGCGSPKYKFGDRVNIKGFYSKLCPRGVVIEVLSLSDYIVVLRGVPNNSKSCPEGVTISESKISKIKG